jgi:hypothetical protein
VKTRQENGQNLIEEASNSVFRLTKEAGVKKRIQRRVEEEGE